LKPLLAIGYDLFKAGLCCNCHAERDWKAQEMKINLKREQDRKKACDWAYNLLQRDDWALVDTETTSLTGVVCEIGVIAPDGTVLFESLINPECPVMPRARAAHGLTDDLLAIAPTLPQIWNCLQTALAGRTVLVAYNSDFDQARLKQSAQRYGLPVLTHQWQCAMAQYAAYCGNWSTSHKSYTCGCHWMGDIEPLEMLVLR
jgi:DNA polymerase III epsilon subunit-like protein